MARPFSLDLRERVVDAVVRGGLSCRQAAARWGGGGGGGGGGGVGQGGPPAEEADRPLARLAAGAVPGAGLHPCADWWRSSPSAACKSTTAQCGSSSTPRGSRTKKMLIAAEQARAPTWRAGGRSGRSCRAGSTRPAGSSSTRPGPRPTWRRSGDGHRAAERLKAAVPHGHWKTMTFLAALRHDRVEAPWLLDGPIDGESFRTVRRAGPGADPSARRHRRHGQPRRAQERRRPPGQALAPVTVCRGKESLAWHRRGERAVRCKGDNTITFRVDGPHLVHRERVRRRLHQ